MGHLFSQSVSAIFGHGDLNAVVSMAIIAGAIFAGKWVHSILS